MVKGSVAGSLIFAVSAESMMCHVLRHTQCFDLKVISSLLLAFLMEVPFTMGVIMSQREMEMNLLWKEKIYPWFSVW